MVVKLYGAAQSTATKRAAVVLLEKGVPFEFIALDTANLEHKSPEYIAKQPFGQMPLLVSNVSHYSIASNSQILTLYSGR